MNEFLIRKLIRAKLQEDFDGGGDFGGDYGGGYGFDPGSKRLYRAFVQPFVDVGETALAGIEKMSNKTQQFAATLLTGLAASLIPFAKGNYKEIDAAADQRAKEISEKYKELFDRTQRELYSDDAIMANFLWNPVRHISGLVAVKSPNMALKLIDIVSGGNAYVKSFTNSVRDKFGFKTENKIKNKKLLSEIGKKDVLTKVVSHPEVKKSIEKSKYYKSMKSDAKKLVKQHVSSAIKKAKGIMNFNSVEDVLKKTGAKIDLDAIKKMEPSERSQAESVVINQAKDLIRNYFKEQLMKYSKKLDQEELAAIVKNGISVLESI